MAEQQQSHDSFKELTKTNFNSDKLNVVGEDHGQYTDEFSHRRTAEKATVEGEGIQYWVEDTFTVRELEEDQGVTLGDSSNLQVRYGAIEVLNHLTAALNNASGEDTETTEQRQRNVILIYGLAGAHAEKVANLKRDSDWVDNDPLIWNTIKNIHKIIDANGADTTIIGEMAQLRMTLWQQMGGGSQGFVVEEKRKEIHIERSEMMAINADVMWDVKGVWKVGNDHIAEMRSYIDKVKGTEDKLEDIDQVNIVAMEYL